MLLFAGSRTKPTGKYKCASPAEVLIYNVPNLVVVDFSINVDVNTVAGAIVEKSIIGSNVN